MTLTLDEIEEASAVIPEWPLPRRVRFLQSKALDTFKRELQRYVQQDIAGRSFLISGHRGAGKTALAARAVDDVSRAVLERLASNDPKDWPPLGISPQRPLFVRVHGPSLLTARLPHVESGNGQDRSPTEKNEADKSDAPSDEVTGSIHGGNLEAQGALVQLTVSLYRALAGEIARTFALHAHSSVPSRLNDNLELAAQLALELDQGPSPATLRTYWARLGKLNPGVLWPRTVADRLPGRGLKDQGMREIIAVATAAQAFQVCTGAIKYTQTKKDKNASNADVDVAGKLDLNGLLTAILGTILGLGAGVGAAGLGASSRAAVATGVASGLMSLLAVGWSSKRSRGSEQGADYSFIRNYSIETLERDLPLVVSRIRESGLAPVFVVDELDKVPNASQSIRRVIARLKHVTTDYGFFCFLTDRDYYETVRHAVQGLPYPEEHTYFSQWLFVLYHPDEFLAYLRSIIKSGGNSATDRGAVHDDWATTLFAMTVLHRSKLNTGDMTRELARHCDASGRILLDEELLRSHAQYKLAATMQMGIQLVLRSPAIATRMEDEPQFAQLAVDAAYMISRVWERDLDEIDLSTASIVRYLLVRLRDAGPADPQDAEVHLRDRLGRLEFDLLISIVQELRRLLEEFSVLRTEINATQPDLSPAVPHGLPSAGLISRVSKESDMWRFEYDTYGRHIRTRDEVAAAVADSGKIPANIREQATKAVDFVQEFELLLGGIGDDLTALGLWPPTISWNTVLQTKEKVFAALNSDLLYPDIAVDIPALQSFSASIAGNGMGLSVAIALIHSLSRRTGSEPTTVLHSIAPFVDLRALAFIAGDSALQEKNVPITGLPKRLFRLFKDVESIRRWRKKETTAGTLRGSALWSASRQAWLRWGALIGRPYSTEESVIASIDYQDLLLVSARQLPLTLLRRDLRAVPVADWSAMCFLNGEADMNAVATAPWWALLMGLRGLGFGPDVLSRVDNEMRSKNTVTKGDSDVARDLIRSAPEQGRPGLLFAALPQNSISARPDFSLGRPVIILNQERLLEYDQLLTLLKNAGAIEGVVYERVQDTGYESAAGASPGASAV